MAAALLALASFGAAIVFVVKRVRRSNRQLKQFMAEHQIGEGAAK